MKVRIPWIFQIIIFAIVVAIFTSLIVAIVSGFLNIKFHSSIVSAITASMTAVFVTHRKKLINQN